MHIWYFRDLKSSHLDCENHLPACHFSESKKHKIPVLRIMSRGFSLTSALPPLPSRDAHMESKHFKKEVP